MRNNILSYFKNFTLYLLVYIFISLKSLIISIPINNIHLFYLVLVFYVIMYKNNTSYIYSFTFFTGIIYDIFSNLIFGTTSIILLISSFLFLKFKKKNISNTFINVLSYYIIYTSMFFIVKFLIIVLLYNNINIYNSILFEYIISILFFVLSYELKIKNFIDEK